MPGRDRVPSFQLASGTTVERDGSYNIGTVGNIFYNTDTSNVEIRHVDSSNSEDWRDLVVNNKGTIDLSGEVVVNNGLRLPKGTTTQRDAHVNIGNIFYNTNTSNVEVYNYVSQTNTSWKNIIVNNRLVMEFYRIGTQTLNTGSFTYFDFNRIYCRQGDVTKLRFHRGNGDSITSLTNINNDINQSPSIRSMFLNVSGCDKTYFFRYYTERNTGWSGADYLEFVAFSNTTIYTSSSNFSSGQGSTLMRTDSGTLSDSLNKNPLMEDDQGISGSHKRFTYSGIVHVKNNHYLHIMLKKNGGSSFSIGNSSSSRLDVVSQLYLCEI